MTLWILIRVKKQEVLIKGRFVVTDNIFLDLWERVKFEVASSCKVVLQVIGLTDNFDATFWDIKRTPRLKIQSAELIFTCPTNGIQGAMKTDRTALSDLSFSGGVSCDNVVATGFRDLFRD